ncbi:phytoene synthase [Sagittula marina]|uniref:Phytoene synthase n=1 Tax=Sagittula marina TaxID=943940 RepID=A0A7W6DRT8_9RHOB|nr:phytoene/squalene synthase family protein [Sagittula marina]MBB3988060.1 phytoene synthase [Sagittula marina]
MIAPKDLEHCVESIRHGSRSFHAASRLLPARVRNPALALYAFCRLADDAVDLQSAKGDAVLRLHDRLDKAYAGRPKDAPADRAFAAIIEEFEMPRALPEALLEGLAWDAMERRYDDLSGLRAYSARVASAVGAMMCVLMRVRDRDALARACDLGVAMQLTNIARDVGEDAREGRLYLPLDWLAEAGIDPDAFLKAPAMTPDLGRVVRRLLREVQGLYHRSEAGIAALPLGARPGIYAARFIYAGIGQQVARQGYDSITRRARTNKAQKLGWLALSILRTGATLALPRSSVIHARPVPETAFLITATADHRQVPHWSDGLNATLEILHTREEERRAALMSSAHGLR